jgi:hypothetical protein
MHVICIYEQICNNPQNMQNTQYKIWCDMNREQNAYNSGL